MEYTEEEKIPGLLLLIDFEKAFDSLSWSFIQKVTKFFNFGTSIRHWILVLYRWLYGLVAHLQFWSSPDPMGTHKGTVQNIWVFL